MLIIDWNKFDDKYNWAAMDSDGSVWLYPKRPELNPIFKQWEVQTGDKTLCIDEGIIGSINDEWVNSLTWKQKPLT